MPLPDREDSARAVAATPPPQNTPQHSDVGIVLCIVQSLRPHQWIKNLFVATPLLFSKHLMSLSYCGRTAIATGLFCLLFGAVYLINDIFDLEKDRLHPQKRFRPIPSGALPIAAAQTASAALIVGTLAISFGLFGLPFFASMAAYLIINLAYSLSLKNVPFVDVALIATGFLLRVLAGGLAIDVPVSPWLFACTFLLSLFLGFGKRTHELSSLSARNNFATRRPVLRHYRGEILRPLMMLLSATVCLMYGLYTVSSHTRVFFGTNKLIVTLPFACFGVVRFYRLAGRGEADDDSPTDAMLHDWPFMLNFACWAVAVVVIIYLR